MTNLEVLNKQCTGTPLVAEKIGNVYVLKDYKQAIYRVYSSKSLSECEAFIQGFKAGVAMFVDPDPGN